VIFIFFKHFWLNIKNILLRSTHSDKLVKRNIDTDSDIEYANSRYACDLKEILKQSQRGSLSFTEYPSIYPMPDESNFVNMATTSAISVRKDVSKYSNRRMNAGAVKTRMIVFVAGGVCFSELRAAQEIMSKGGQEVIVGGTSFVNPTTFIDNLKAL
jgi:syntaxin-binding protein 1